MTGARPGGTRPDAGRTRRARDSILQAAAAALLAVAVLPATAVTLAGPANAAPLSTGHGRQILTTGLQGSVGSTVGPDGALYVTEAVAGRVSRVDPRTGRTSTYVSGLPRRVLPGLGGAMDVAFLRGVAYVLVTLVSPDVGGTDIDGVYRVDGPHRFTLVADIGAWSMAHPPATPFFVPTGVQYALQPYRGGLAGHRRAPQPRAEGQPARRRERDRHLAERRPDRAGDPGQHGVRGPGRTDPAPAAGWQGARPGPREPLDPGGGVGRAAARRRGGRPPGPAVRAVPGPVHPWPRGRLAGRSEHRSAAPGRDETAS